MSPVVGSAGGKPRDAKGAGTLGAVARAPPSVAGAGGVGLAGAMARAEVGARGAGAAGVDRSEQKGEEGEGGAANGGATGGETGGGTGGGESCGAGRGPPSSSLSPDRGSHFSINAFFDFSAGAHSTNRSTRSSLTARRGDVRGECKRVL